MKLRSLAAIVCMLLAASVQAQRRAPDITDPDAAFVAARQAAVQNNDPDRFEAVAPLAAEHPLRMYVDYWRLRLRIADGRPDAEGGADAEIRQFLARHAGSVAADLLRRDWLVNLGKRRDWASFDAQYPLYVVRDEPAVACFELMSRMQRGESVAAAARELLLKPRELGDACHALFEGLLQTGAFGQADVQQRLKMAIESNSATALRRTAAWLSTPIEPRVLDAAVNRSQLALTTGLVRNSPEAAMIAVSRLARTDPVAAADWLAYDRTLKNGNRAFAFSQLAVAGQKRLLPFALDWVRQSADAGASDDTLAWHARAALAALDWKLLQAVIDQMSEAGRREPTWVYWRARALRADGRGADAETLFKSIASQPHFYGQLASEELGALQPLPATAAPTTADELAEAGRNPAFARAREFYRLGMRFEGNREWNFAMRGLSDRQLLAAAEWARRQDMLDRTVFAADRTQAEHDFALRFPTPFRDRLMAAARERGLDPAWVYGLIRQESRFIMDARSHVGAQGLMQIMPATARWIARKVGATDFSVAQLGDIDTNLSFGTFYLKQVMDDLGGSPLLASAAYNAGPNRPRNWRAQLAQTVDGAVFAEIVPFDETRDYVKKVLSNATIYASMFAGRPQSLKAWLGSVQPRAAGQTDLP